MAGDEAPDKGAVSIRQGARVGHLAQIPRLRPEGTTVEEVLRPAFKALDEVDTASGAAPGTV